MIPMIVDVECLDISASIDPEVPIWCVSFCSAVGKGYSLQWPEARDHLLSLLSEQEATAKTNGRNKKPKWKFFFHNACFDVPTLRLRGVNIPPGRYEDTMLLSYCIDTSTRAHGLNDLGLHYLGRGKAPQPDFSGYSEQMADYAINDAELTFELACILRDKLKDDEDAFNHYMSIDLPYLEICMQMHQTGAYLDIDALIAEQKKTKQYAYELRKEIITTVPRPPVEFGTGLVEMVSSFNPNSNTQVADALKRLYQWEPKKKTKTGQPKVDKYVLEELHYPLARLLLEYNKYEKFDTAFLTPIRRKLETEKTDRIHGNFNPCVTRTGRLSSSGPNLQNIPARDNRGDTIRSMFVPPEGYSVIVGDLDRIELVVLGFYLELMLGYTKLSDRLKAGEDVHQSNTDEWSSITGQHLERKKCKNGIFSLIYGAGCPKFSVTIGVVPDIGQRIYDSSELVLAVHDLADLIVDEAMDNNGVIHNFFGRRLVVPELKSRNRKTLASGQRKVFNYVIQGTAGDAFKWLQLQAAKIPSQIPEAHLHQSIVVHDESVYYALTEYAEKCASLLTDTYTNDSILRYEDVTAPINCEFNYGTNWYEAKS